MNKIPVNIIRDAFDLDDGKFSLVQNDLLLCYNFIGGVRGTIAVSLFNRIISNVYLQTLKVDEEVLRVGSLWSNPITIHDVMSDSFSGFSSESKYRSAKNNYNMYITDLLENKVFYRFGKNNFYAYTYEKNVFSWGYMCKDFSYIYPQTLKRLIKTEGDLWDLFWNVKKPGSESYVMELDEFMFNFASFIDDKIVYMAPSVKNLFRRFDKISENARLYIDEIKKILENVDDFAGYEEDCMFNNQSMPISLQEKFGELVPSDEKNYTHQKNNRSRSQLYGVRRKLVKFKEVENLEESELKVSENPEHLLSLFERRVKSIRGFEKDRVVFKNIALECLACKELYDLLVGLKVNKESFIREWIDWYVHHRLDIKINAGHVAINSMIKTFNEFSEKKSREESERGAYSSLYENIEDSFVKSVDIESICRKYGFVFVYNYLLVTQGRKEAESHFESLLLSLESMPAQTQKSALYDMQKATHCNRSRRCGFFDKDSEIKKKLGELMVKTCCTYKDFGLSVLERPNSEETAFWEKIKYELADREKNQTK